MKILSSNGWTYETLSIGELGRDNKNRPRYFKGKIKNRYGIWLREYRVKINVNQIKSFYPLGTVDGISYTVKPRA